MESRGLCFFRRDENGAALIEAALVLPVLLMLVFAMADLSLYFWQRSLVTKAVDLGVRMAIVSDAVAEGPGLTPAESASYWFGLTPGARCASRDGTGLQSACPVFSVTCDASLGCRCSGGGCRFAFSRRNLVPILTAMRAVIPRLEPANLRVTYGTNGLGYVGRPLPVSVDVTVQVVDFAYDPIFAGLLFARAFPLAAAATLPGEDLVTRR